MPQKSNREQQRHLSRPSGNPKQNSSYFNGRLVDTEHPQKGGIESPVHPQKGGIESPVHPQKGGIEIFV